MSHRSSSQRLTSAVLAGRLGCAICAVVAITCWWSSNTTRSTDLSTDGSQNAPHLVAYSASDSASQAFNSISTRPIEEIQVGDRVLARNPAVDDRERSTWDEPNWQAWYHISLQMPKATNEGAPEVIEIELLRPESWIREHVDFIVHRQQAADADGLATLAWGETDAEITTQDSSLVPLSPLRGFYRHVHLTLAVIDAGGLQLAGMSADLNLPELGAIGTAIVTDVKNCPPVRSGGGQVVTATFAHPPSSQVLDVWFDGESKSIGVTDNHLFWSVDQAQFLPIGQMEIGDRVLTELGDTKRITHQLPRPGPQVVYNLEVYGEHVYYVGQQGILVHNSCLERALAAELKRVTGRTFRGYNGLKAEVAVAINAGNRAHAARLLQRVRGVGAVRSQRIVDAVAPRSGLPPGVVFEGTIYRAVNPKYASSAFGFHAPSNLASNHRYTGIGRGGIYSGTSRKAVLGELAHYKIDPSNVAWVTKDIRVSNVLDLTNPAVRRKLGVALKDITGDSYLYTHAIGDLALSRGYNGILFPAARARGATNFVELVNHAK